MFEAYEVPVAFSMLSLQIRADDNVSRLIQDFMCKWVAFNNIYTAVSDREGRGAEYQRGKDGEIKIRSVGKIRMPDVRLASEREQILLAVDKMSSQAKHAFIAHPSAAYFVRRTPRWKGQPIAVNQDGQKLNGVINVGRTIDSEHPVWSPIDVQLYEAYIGGQKSDQAAIALSAQVALVLYTVRNNIFHAGKRADDAHDMEVVQHAIPLLSILLSEFFQEAG